MTTTYDAAEAFRASASYFPTALQQFQFFDKYSRFDYGKGRRETFQETVTRSVDYLYDLAGSALPQETYAAIEAAMLRLDAIPSMRLMAMAGAAAKRSNITIYNCSYMPVDDLRAFPEALIISMSGCGVGFSVERQYVDRLPPVAPQQRLANTRHHVEDTAEGWAAAITEALNAWWLEGRDIKFDFSAVRAAGAPLITKGGRASGPDPLRFLLNEMKRIILARQGGKVRPIDAHDIMCLIGGAAVSGGMRRTAMISLFSADDPQMMQAKSGDIGTTAPWRWNANNSIVWDHCDESVFNAAFDEMIASGNGEPGLFSRTVARRLVPERRAMAEFGTNPCVTGDTWIAVADGRGRVRMADLVASGSDVDVFTVKDGELVVRTMRNPRKTGTQVPVLRVTFADGTYIRATANHRFVTLDGQERTTAELQPNDALTAMTVFSYQKRGLPSTHKVDYDQLGSYRMVQFGSYRKSEHRIVYAHHANETVLTGIDDHIHHRDFDGRNNHISNLERLSAADHAVLHRNRMLGNSNPACRLMNNTWRANLSNATRGARNGNAKPVSNEQLEQAIIKFVADLGYRPSSEQYVAFAKSNGLPQTFQEYRRNYFGGTLQETLALVAQRLGYEAPRYARREVKSSDLPIHYRDGKTYVTRSCEICGTSYEVRFSRREQATCSVACGQKLYYRLHGSETLRQALLAAHENAKGTKRRQQITIYNDLVFTLGRHPLKQEWVSACKRQGISAEIARVSSPFQSWQALTDEARATNHRVVSVEHDGYDDVYTGTVDDTHTFFSIGCERLDRQGRGEMAYVLSWQCGEILLRPMQFCNLSAAVARADDTIATLTEKVRLASIIGTIQSLATHFPGLRPEWKRNCEEERLLGVDINGQMDCPAVRKPEALRYLKEVAVKANAETAALLGINASAAVTCVKPSGNSSQLLNCSSGLHARWSPYYIRNVRVSTHSPLFGVLRDAGVPMDPENGQTVENATTYVVHFPVKAPKGAIVTEQLSAIDQCEYWLTVKREYTEHNPSCTITYRPEEAEELRKWVWEHRDMIGGLSFLPAFDAKYAQMPYEKIGKTLYTKLAAAFPPIDFSRIMAYEDHDMTSAAQELACVAGACEIDLPREEQM